MLNEWPTSIREVNNLPAEQQREIYGFLLPEWLFTDYGIDRETFERNGYPAVQLRAPKNSRAVEVIVRRHPSDMDPMLYLNMADTFQGQLMVLLIVVNDPDSPRYNTDVDSHGNRTHYGTVSRNVYAELEAMNAGLAPGQIRRGMRVFRSTVPLFEQFIERMGHDLFMIEPLAYHNAITFERYGFNYVRGLRDMHEIHEQFQPHNQLYNKLTEENPFRHPDHWQTVRGRSWAIHDGILGHPFTGFQMYKRVGHDAGINTFPDAKW